MKLLAIIQYVLSADYMLEKKGERGKVPSREKKTGEICEVRMRRNRMGNLGERHEAGEGSHINILQAFGLSP